MEGSTKYRAEQTPPDTIVQTEQTPAAPRYMPPKDAPRTPAPTGSAGPMTTLGWIASVLPGLLCLAVLVIAFVLPLIFSLTDYNMLSEPKIVGPGNYEKLLNHNVFAKALSNTLTDMLVIGWGGFVLSLLIAWGLRGLPTVLRYVPIAVLCLPALCPGLINTLSVVFRGDAYGDMNSLLLQAGVLNEPVLFMQTPEIAPHLLRLIQLWRSIGPGVLVISAGLDGVRHACAREIRQRRLEKSFFVWQVTLPRMRAPLMIAALVMMMGAMGTATVSSQLAGMSSAGYCAHTLWLMMQDYGFTRFKMGYASAIVVVTNLLTVLMLLPQLLTILLLTWRPARKRYARQDAPPEFASRPRSSGTKAFGMIIGLVVSALCCLPVLLLALRQFNLSLKPLEELFRAEYRFFAAEPTLSNYSDLFTMLFEKNGYNPFMRLVQVLLYGFVPVLLALGVGLLSGRALSKKRRTGLRWLLLAVLAALLLASPVMYFYDQFQPTHRFSAVTFGQVMSCLMWVFVPASVALGLSMGAMRGRRHPHARLLLAAGGFLALVLLLGWGIAMKPWQMVTAGGAARAGVASAAVVLMDLLPMLLSVPLVAGVSQILTGLGNVYPLYRGGNE